MYAEAVAVDCSVFVSRWKTFRRCQMNLAVLKMRKMQIIVSVNLV